MVCLSILGLISLGVRAPAELAPDSIAAQGSFAKATANDFEFVIQATNNVFELGRPIVLFACLKNVSTNVATVPVRDGVMEYSFEIIAPGNKRAATTAFGDRMLTPVVLFHQSAENIAPGQMWTDSIPLSSMFVMTNSGEYRITVTREVSFRRETKAGPLSICVTNSAKQLSK